MQRSSHIQSLLRSIRLLSHEEQDQLFGELLHLMADRCRKNKNNSQDTPHPFQSSSCCCDDILELAQLLKHLSRSHADIIRQIF